MIVDVQSPQFGLGELLGATFRLLKLQFIPLLKAFLPLVGLIVLVAGLSAAGVYGAIQYAGFYNPQKLDSFPMIIQIIGSVITAIMFVIALGLFVIAVMQVTADSCGGQSIPTPREILSRAWDRVPAYWGTTALLFLGALIVMSPALILVTFVVITGPIALLMTCVAAIYIIFTMEAVAVRNHSGIAAIRYSYALVKGRFWQTLGYVFILGLVGWAIAAVPMFIIQIVMAVLVPIVQGMTVATVVVMGAIAICMLLLQLLFQLFFYIGHTIMFLRWESSKANPV